MSDTILIPDDLATCQERLREALAVQAQLAEMCATLQVNQEKLQQEHDELLLTIKNLQNQLYGRRSERLDESPGQQHLTFDLGEPLTETLSALAALDQADAAFVEEVLAKRRQKKKRPTRSEQLPEHLERRTERIEPSLPPGSPFLLEDCQLIGVDVVECLEYERPVLWVRRLEYPKYKVPLAVESLMSESVVAESIAVESIAVESIAAASLVVKFELSPPVMLQGHGILQAPRIPNVIEGGRFGFGVVTEVLHNKFALHLPLYRQQDVLAQLGWPASRSTLCQIVTNGAELLRPLADLLRVRVLSNNVLGTDDTPVTLLTPRVGDGSRTARFWLYRGRDGTPYDVFDFTDSREREGPDTFLETFCR